MNKGPFEINLCCPECGCVEWAGVGEGVFECITCGCNCTFEEMTPQAFDAE